MTTSGFDELPPEWLARIVANRFVMDTGEYLKALESGLIKRRPMFTRFDDDAMVWSDGSRERADAVIYATGYRPDLAYLEPLGALEAGTPRHYGGISTTHLGLVYVGLEFQRSFSSNTSAVSTAMPNTYWRHLPRSCATPQPRPDCDASADHSRDSRGPRRPQRGGPPGPRARHLCRGVPVLSLIHI